ncbi:hypothetical protein ABIB96_009179 [Bradyrhizobium sp. LA3.X]
MASPSPPNFQLFSLADDPDGLWVAPTLGRISRHELSIDIHRHPNAPAGRGLDIEVRFRIFLQRLNNKCADLSRNRPANAFRQSNSIVRDEDAIPVVAPAQTFDRDHALFATIECTFEGVGQDFIYN